ncbi:hypothetical protein EG835_05890 [bacterium]|nr:hypothetical protein [bacterium]
MKKILVTVLVVAFIATLINDVGRYARARYELGNIARDTAENIALSGEHVERNTNATAAATYAATRGATVYLYDQDEKKAYVWVEMPVEGTWVWAPLAAQQAGQPKGTPLKIQLDYSAFWK